MEITVWLVCDGYPFGAVDTPAYKRVMTYLAPKANLKHSTTFAKYKVPLLYLTLENALQKKLETDLKDCKMATLTMDHWSSVTTDSYLGVTLHYMDKNFK